MTRHLSRSRLLALGALVVGGAAIGVTRWLTGADHRDSLVLTDDRAADIADVYSFLSPANPNNLVLAMTVSGFIPPPEVGSTFFDPGVLYQWHIDTNGDAREDLVIQAFVTGDGPNQVMHFRGPSAPAVPSPSARALKGLETATVRVSNGPKAIVGSRGGLTVFAGVRDDPFFFDLVRFREIIAGTQTAFRNPGVDTFAGTNVLAIVVELPIAMLGGNPNLGIWGTTSRPM